MTTSRFFGFEKWYFDFALPTGEVIFFFLAATRILGRRDLRLSLTVSSPREAPVHRSANLGQPAGGQPASCAGLLRGFGQGLSPAASEIPFRFSGKDLEVDLVFVRHPESRPAARSMVIRRGGRRIRWEPVHGRSLVRGTVRAAGRTWRAEGDNGYIDRLNSDIFPLFTPVRTLYWGRLHQTAGSLVFAVIPRPRPAALLTWESERGRLEFDTAEVVERGPRVSATLGLAYPSAYTLTAVGGSGSLRLDVENSVTAVETGFIADEGLPSGLESRALAFLARNPRGIKFFSRGRGRVEEPGRTVQIEDAGFFSEYVKFS